MFVVHFKWSLASAILPRLCLTAFTFAQPFLIERVIKYITDIDSANSNKVGYGLIGAYCLVYTGIGVRRYSTLMIYVTANLAFRFPPRISSIKHTVSVPSFSRLLKTCVEMNLTSYKLITMIRGNLVNLIYQRTLELSSISVDQSVATTLMSADVERIGTGLRQMHDVWAGLIEIGLAMWLLATQLGVAAVAAGIVSLGRFFGKLFHRYQD